MVFLNEIFHFSMRWQQLFSYLRNSAVKVLFKALEAVPLGVFTDCACVCASTTPHISFLLSPSLCLSPSLSVSLFVFLFWRQSSAMDHLFIRPKSFCSETVCLCWSQQTSRQSSGPNYSSAWGGANGRWEIMHLEEKIASFLQYAFIFVKRFFRGLKRNVTDEMRAPPVFL